MSQALQSALAKHLSGDVRFDDPTRLIYSTDASNYKILPLGVVLPRTHDDIAATVQLCAEHGVPVTARGGGSGLAGQAIGPGVIIDTTRYMDALLDLDVSGRSVRVQPGMILGQLNKKLAAHGLRFGPDPASAERAAIGGVIGTNATGSHSIRYGMTADNIDALRCVLADGSELHVAASAPTAARDALTARVQDLIRRVAPDIARDFPRVWRRASGYNIDFLAEMLAYDPADPEAALMPGQAARAGLNRATHLRQISRWNLAPLIAGSEGTLAVVSEATLHLHPTPKHTALAITSFESLIDAMRAIPALLSIDPAAIELIGGMFITLARNVPECRGRMGWLDVSEGAPEGLLVIELDGESPAAVEAALTRLQNLVARAHLPCTIKPLRDAGLQNDVWFVRRIGLNVLASLRSAFKPISVIEDIAVPVETLPAYVERLNAIFAAHGTEGAYYAHASAGVLHVRPLVNLRTRDGVKTMQAIARDAFALCRELGGAMSGEHGDGYERSRWNRALYGDALYRAFVEVKQIFDPRGLLNPNKKVAPLGEAQLETMMRLGPDHADRPLPRPTTFAFARDGSMAALAAECNGSGVCRKPEGGVMCPSYRATREEMHSTRGRANLLREFLIEKQGPGFRFQVAGSGSAGTGAEPETRNLHPATWNQHSVTPASATAVRAALDLCLSCKACASECASGVDMAKLKSEFMQLQHDANGTPLRARMFGNIAGLSRLAARFPPLANAVLRSAMFKRALGIAPERALPPIARQTFDDWWRKHTPARKDAAPRVALFVDTFSRYNHPDVAIAAVQVLEALGFHIEIPSLHCCGRPLISQGQPRAARNALRAVINALYPYAQRGLPILALEPSCQSALTDDALDLAASAETTAVARALHSVEDFLAGQPGLPALPNPAAMRAPIVLHGHCHQKALWGTAGVRRLFARLGIPLTEIDSTCCGMAGAFGYEAEHAALSKQIGELALLPAVRAADPACAILAAGTSCREQIAGLAGRAALHPVTYVARLMDQAA